MRFAAILSVAFMVMGDSVEAMPFPPLTNLSAAVGTMMRAVKPSPPVRRRDTPDVGYSVSEMRGGGIHFVADPPIGVRIENSGRCNLEPPNLELVKKSGVNYYEFCDYPVKDNHVYADVHKKSGAGGDMGRRIQTLTLECDEYEALLTDKAKEYYCND